MRKKYILITLLVIILGGASYGLWDFFSTPNAENIQNWTTYRDEQYNFEVKHPKEWTITKETNDINPTLKKYTFVVEEFKDHIISERVGGAFSVEFFHTDDNEASFERLVATEKKIISDDRIVEEIQINGLHGYKTVEYYQNGQEKDMWVIIYLLDKDKQWVLRIIGRSYDWLNKSYQEQIKLMLSTFKFLEL